MDIIFCNNLRRYTSLPVSKSTLRRLHIHVRFPSSTKEMSTVYLWRRLERTEENIEKFNVTFCVETVPVKQQ